MTYSNFKTFALILGATSIFSASCNDKKTTTENKTETTAAVTTETTTKANDVPEVKTATRFAYVDADTLSENYVYLKEKRKYLENKQASIKAELTKKNKAFQDNVVAFQKKAQAGTLTQTEGESMQKKLEQDQNNLGKRTQELEEQFYKEQAAIQTEFENRLEQFLKKYNEDKKYDFIFSHSKKNGQILYANEALDITKEVLDAMNAEAKAPATTTAK